MKMKNGDLLFVYGSLQTCFENPVARMLRANSRLIGPAQLHGTLFLVSWYPGLIASENPADVVYGELVELSPKSDGFFTELDAYEDIGPEFPKPHEFARVEREVTCADQRFEGWVYEYCWPIDGAKKLADGRYTSELYQALKEKAAQNARLPQNGFE